MKNFSNTYIFGFSTVMVLVVAALLSFVAEELRPMQERNVELEKMTDILRSVEKTEGMEDAEDRDQFIENQFSEYINKSFVVNNQGNILDGRDAFEITKDLKAELDKPVEERGLPVFVFEGTDGKNKYIISVYGKGLWGPIWGYVAVNNDFNTISGAIFDHSKETPGLGAEINTDWFAEMFEGKTLFDEDGNFVSIKVVKGGVSGTAPHSVDAISGGTITSKGVEEMLYDCLKPYLSYFKQQKN